MLLATTLQDDGAKAPSVGTAPLKRCRIFVAKKSIASMVLAQSYRQRSTKCAPTNRVLLQLQRPVFLSLPRVGPHCARHKLSMNIFWKNNGSAMKRAEKKNYSRGWKIIDFVICKKAVPEKIKTIEGGREGARKRERIALSPYTPKVPIARHCRKK